MNKLSNEERERLKKMNETFLYEVGYEHMNNICDETDRLLEEYKELEVPDSLNQWFVDYNKELIRKKQNEAVRRRILKLSKRIAAVLIIICIAGSAVTMSVEAFRVNFFNLVIETFQKYSLVSQEEINGTQMVYDVPSDWTDYYYPKYLPKGYYLLNTRSLVDTRYMTFSNLEGNEMRFIQGNLSSQSQIDSENGNVINVEIRGCKGVLVVKDDITIINWTTNDMSFTIQGNVEKSVLLAIAESVEKNK